MSQPPPNLSWVGEYVVGSAYPFANENFDYISQRGIRAIINLSERSYQIPPDLQLKSYHFPIPDFSIPSPDLVLEILNIIEYHVLQQEPVLVHCIAGCGRTGTILGLWLKKTRTGQPVDQIIADLRKLRPCSLETEEQLEFVRNIEF